MVRPLKGEPQVNFTAARPQTKRNFNDETKHCCECEVAHNSNPASGSVVKVRFKLEKDAKKYARSCTYYCDKVPILPVKNHLGTYTVIIGEERFKKLYGESTFQDLISTTLPFQKSILRK